MMGNCLWCSASGKELMAAAEAGDLEEVRQLLEMKPALAQYVTFPGLSSPLHVAASGGHSEIATLLLEKGADANSRNLYGQTPLMEACRNGCWEVVQSLLLFKCNVSKEEYLSGWTALHFAAQGGHIPCIRLLLADFAPSARQRVTDSSTDENELPNSSSRGDGEDEFSRFINKAAGGGITALHLAALSGNADCVHLLLDLHADVSATALYHSSSAVSNIGAGSTPLHYAACSGSLKSCQVLLARGASKLEVNGHGWLPVDIARIRGSHELVPLLSPLSEMTVPAFPISHFPSLPLISVLKLAREHGLQSTTVPSDDTDLCAVCLESACTVAAEGCGHELCTRCALCLCSTSNMKPNMSASIGSIPCPLCREGIMGFKRLLSSLPVKQNPSAASSRPEFRKNPSAVVPLEAIDPILSPPQIPAAMISCTRQEQSAE
ncbi:putative E3 ubiquitin-protein ligase XBOS33 [Canna indica]|uniref:RING-type E3 ubiquitin transferase n=1 Tax=Canna indica TaxID=4628 RepID=A0AAQ3KRP3_9LILI|nr:putative E3 ubiquitin-protein ligase XBOS33 [Canna indica]